MSDLHQPVEIIGGGLAGLALGLALRRAGVPVTLFEAGEYPRQRVCGEFMTGLDDETIAHLGVRDLLADAILHDRVAWFHRDRLIFRQQLPEPARALSRWVLDARMADALAAAGGKLVTGTRVEPAPKEGRVIAAGRRRSTMPWMGLKMHLRGLKLAEALELHLGLAAYVGVCRLGNDEVNLCGLFRRQSLAGHGRRELLIAYLEASGMGALARRVVAAETCAGSEAAVAGMDFGHHPPAADELSLGDACCTLPPFLGNGMAAAFQMAAEASGPLVRWSSRDARWDETAAEVHRRVRRRFRRRLGVGRFLHRLLLSPTPQGWLAGLARTRCLPTRLLYHALH